jgi:hypothetical protein
VIARLRGEIAEQAAIAHAVLVQSVLGDIDIGGKPLQRRKLIVAQRFPHRVAGPTEIEIEDLQAERFLRRKVIGERPLRNASRLNDVANARACETALVHDPQAFGQNLLSI